jgi:hypothetical protein
MGTIEDNAIRPFHINILEEELVDLRLLRSALVPQADMHDRLQFA